MRGRILSPALLLAALTACADHPQPTAESDASAPIAAAPAAARPLSASERSDEVRLEALARRVARALGNPAFRAYVKTELDASGYAEHKVQFQRFLRANGGRALRELASATSEREADVAADADAAVPLEMYLPVPAHRAGWQGGDHVLVATAIADHEAPIAFDVRGERQVLDPLVPPAVPVIAVVKAETNFNQPPARTTCVDCTGGNDTGTPSSGGTITTSEAATPGLYLTYAGFAQDFEGWLKGDPEFEIHILGPASPTDTTSLASFQCVGEKAPGGYAWDMNQLSWSGSQLIFSSAQMDAYNTAFPGRAFVIFAVEDDDTACGIRTDSDRGNALLKALSAVYNDYKGAKDQTTTILGQIQRLIKAARTGSKFLSSAYSFLKSNDDIIGIAVSDSVRGRYNDLTNWTVLDKNLNTNGVFRLEMH